MNQREASISKRVRHAVALLVDEARSRSEAAKLAGITDDWLYRELRRPEVQALRRERLQVLRSSEAARSVQRTANLADAAESEHVRLAANIHLMGIEGISPITRTEGRVEHAYQGLAPGLTIIFGQSRPATQLIDGKLVEASQRQIGLRPRTPHPLEKENGK